MKEISTDEETLKQVYESKLQRKSCLKHLQARQIYEAKEQLLKDKV